MLKLWDLSCLVSFEFWQQIWENSKRDAGNLWGAEDSFPGLLVTIQVISPCLPCFPHWEKYFVSLNPFGKCFYKEDFFTIRSIFLFKWDIMQLALDPGAGHLCTDTSQGAAFLLVSSYWEGRTGKRSSERQNKQEQKRGGLLAQAVRNVM